MTTAADKNGQPSSDLADIAETIKRLHEFSTVDVSTLGAAPVAVIPEGKTLISLKKTLDEFRLLPERRRGTAKLRDADSFIAIVERFRGDTSAIFANPDRSAPSVSAVFDYHPKGNDATKADWMQHRATYAPELSAEWRSWNNNNAKWMTQGDFAAFIEEHVTDLIVAALDDPKLKTFAELVDGAWANPTDMVRLSRSLQVNVESVVKNAQTLNSGEVSIIFEEIHKDGAGAPLKVPNLFTIAIPVFFAGDLYRIAARLRYRVANGKIAWMYQLVRADLVFDHAFDEMLVKVASMTEVPVFLGTPEA